MQLDEEFAVLEVEVKRGTRRQRDYTDAVDKMISPLASAMPEICIRHTSESTWFHKRLRQPIPHSTVDKEVELPSLYEHKLGIFAQNIRDTLAREKALIVQKDKDVTISKKKILSTAQLFRIAASLPYLFQF